MVYLSIDLLGSPTLKSSTQSRLVLRAFRTSPIISLYTEVHEAPLQLRCEKLALQYYTKLKSCPSNPAYNCNFNPKYKKKIPIKLFGLWMEPILQESAIPFTNVHKSILPQIPSWIIKKPQVILQLNKLPKTKTHPNTCLEKFHTILLHHPDNQYIFMDGSKDSNKTACTAVLNKTIHKKALPMKSFFFTAEVCAIDLAHHF